MAEVPFNPLGAPTGFTGVGSIPWIKRTVRGVLEEENFTDVWAAKIKGVLADIGAAEAARVANEKEAVDWTIGKLKESPDALRLKIAELIVWELQVFTGLVLPVDVVHRITKGEVEPKGYAALGEPLFTFLTSQVAEARIIRGHLERDTGAGELVSVSALMGASLRLQLGAQYIRHLAAALPSQFKQGVETVAEMVDKSINLDDAIEDMIQEPLQGWVQQGFTKLINRRSKPVDYSDTEVNQLFLADKINSEIRNKVLDNLGVRDDIRDNLLDLAAPNLTESDIDQAYQHNLLSADEVKEQYRDKSFREPERSIKTELVVKQRRWKLEEKVFELYGNLYRDGVATRAEVTPFLESFGYEADEVEMWFKVQELERRQRRWLSVKNVTDLVGAGLMQADFAIDYLVAQGMTGEDATLLMMEDLLAKHAKDLPEDCKKILTDAFSLPKVLGAALAKIPEFGFASLFGKSELQKIVECLLKQAGVTKP